MQAGASTTKNGAGAGKRARRAAARARWRQRRRASAACARTRGARGARGIRVRAGTCVGWRWSPGNSNGREALCWLRGRAQGRPGSAPGAAPQAASNNMGRAPGDSFGGTAACGGRAAARVLRPPPPPPGRQYSEWGGLGGVDVWCWMDGWGLKSGGCRGVENCCCCCCCCYRRSEVGGRRCCGRAGPQPPAPQPVLRRRHGCRAPPAPARPPRVLWASRRLTCAAQSARAAGRSWRPSSWPPGRGGGGGDAREGEWVAGLGWGGGWGCRVGGRAAPRCGRRLPSRAAPATVPTAPRCPR